MPCTLRLRVAEGWRAVTAASRRLVGRRGNLGKRAPGQIPTASIVVSILLALYATAGAAAIPASERAVLLNLYANTNGAGWGIKTNWNGAAGTECTWYGVSCDAGGNTVIRINLFSNNLTGTLPQIAGLTNLENFNVGYNALTGSIPSLSGLTSLRFFVAANNQLTGTIPSLASLASLQNFVVTDNGLIGSIPALPGNIQIFNVDRNQLSGSIPSFGGLYSLTWFSASSNRLTGTIPFLDSLISLTIFDVHGNQLSGMIPSIRTNFQQFDVSANQLSGNVPAVPSPSALVAGGSSLCPNALSRTPDAAWDVATGVSPWYANCAIPPSVTTSAATNVTSTTATLNAVASSNGASTEVMFEFGLTASYGGALFAEPRPLAAGATNAAVSATLAPILACNTLYHFRAIAANSASAGAATNGADATFTTAACPVTAPLACTLSNNPTTVPASGGTVVQTVTCLNGTPPFTYRYSLNGIPNDFVSSNPTNFVISANATGNQRSWSVTVQVTNGDGSSTTTPAVVVTQLAAAPPLTAPSGCTISATPTSLPSAGGTVQLNASCTSPSSGITYAWSKNSAPFSTAQNPTDTLPANAATTAVTYAYQATACLAAFPQTCTVIAPVSVTVAAAPVLGTPSACSISATPIALPAGGGSVALGVSCAAGGAPTSYTWTASPSVTYTSGGTTTVPTNGAAITQPTTFTVVASNAAGGSTAASVTVAVGAPPASTLKPTAEQLVRFADAAYGNARLGRRLQRDRRRCDAQLGFQCEGVSLYRRGPDRGGDCRHQRAVRAAGGRPALPGRATVAGAARLRDLRHQRGALAGLQLSGR